MLRNAVAMFHVLELEREWRVKNGKKLGYETLAAHPPIVAVGAEGPLEGEKLMADYFRVPPPPSPQHTYLNAANNWTGAVRWN